MKKNANQLSVQLAVMAGLVLTLAAPAAAETFTRLHDFTSAANDGANPICGLVLAGNRLYGTTSGGGQSGGGTVFGVNTDGSGYTNLYSFAAGSTNDDGNNPESGLVSSGTTLYGTALSGGAGGTGTLFAVSKDGGFEILHEFSAVPSYTNRDGAMPQGRLVLSDNMLYGTTQAGGTGGSGTIFVFNLETGVFKNLYNFTARSGLYPYTNTDGCTPSGGLTLFSNTLYGTTLDGGTMNYGTVFAIHTDGTGFTNLHNCTFMNDGAHPRGGVVLCGNTLYGTAQDGGSNNFGTIFAINTNGTGFKTLYAFRYSNGDGRQPIGKLLGSSNTLYGTTALGGSYYNGNVFAIHTDGTGFTNLYSFTTSDFNANTNTDGYFPQAGLILSGNTLYGTASEGGDENLGTVFSLSLAITESRPELQISHSGNMVKVYWQAVTGWTLQGNSDLSTTNWVTPPEAINNDGTNNYILVNLPVGNEFYRLFKP